MATNHISPKLYTPPRTTNPFHLALTLEDCDKLLVEVWRCIATLRTMSELVPDTRTGNNTKIASYLRLIDPIKQRRTELL